MSVTASDIQDLPSGEFASIANNVVEVYIAEAEREISQAAFGNRADDAVKYLAAHLLAVAKGGSSAPATGVTMVTVGPLTKQYGQPGAMSKTDSLESTSYGRRYIEIRHQCVGGMWVT